MASLPSKIPYRTRSQAQAPEGTVMPSSPLAITISLAAHQEQMAKAIAQARAEAAAEVRAEMAGTQNSTPTPITHTNATFNLDSPEIGQLVIDEDQQHEHTDDGDGPWQVVGRKRSNSLPLATQTCELTGSKGKRRALLPTPTTLPISTQNTGNNRTAPVLGNTQQTATQVTTTRTGFPPVIIQNYGDLSRLNKEFVDLHKPTKYHTKLTREHAALYVDSKTDYTNLLSFLKAKEIEHQ